MLWSISTLCNDARVINRELYWFRILVPKKLCQIYSIFCKHLRMEPSNLKKKIKEPLYVTEELSNLILELYNVIMEPSNLRNK